MQTLTSSQRIIMSVSIIIIFSILIYVLIKLIKKEQIKSIETKFLTLDDVIKIKTMTELIKYRINQGENTFFSLMMITIDHFDQIKDYTEETGINEYMMQLGKRLESYLPIGAKIAQTEERETFIVYIPEYLNQEAFNDLADEFTNLSQRPIELSTGIMIQKCLSIALITYPDLADSYETLIERLKLTLYTIKKQGGNMTKHYSNKINLDPTSLESYLALKNAIDHHQIKQLYTPIYSKTSKSLFGVEVDLIWENEEKEKSFQSFMPNLESTHDDYWIGLWMLEKALSVHGSLRSLHQYEDYALILPVGVRQFENKHVVADIETLLEKYGVKADRLVLKILNPLQVNKEVEFIKTLIALQNLGVQVALEITSIDDQLYYLINEYKVNTLFIDQTLLQKQSLTIETEELITYTKNHAINIIASNNKKLEHLEHIEDSVDMIKGPYLSMPLDSKAILNPDVQILKIQ